jgi:hypothetical protein
MRPSPLPLLILLLLILPVHVLALSTPTTNITAAPTPAYNNTRIQQGQCIEIGGTYDISGVIGFSFTTEQNTFGWYGKYESGFDPAANDILPTYKYEMPNGRSAYYTFYIDKEIFGNRTGYWYQYTATYERAANKRAFYVSDKCIVQTIKPASVSTNESVIVIDNNVEKVLEKQGIVPVALSPRHLADILISRDSSLNIQSLSGNYQVWFFGRINGIYGKSVNFDNSTLIFTKDEIGGMEAGSYKLLLQTAGSNKMFELSYNRTENQEMLVPLLRAVVPVEITGSQPRLVQPQVESILSKSTDDTYTIYNIEIQEPYLEINGYQEIIVNFDKSILEVAGYTNQQPNSKLQLTIDHNVRVNRSDKFKPVDVIVENGDPGSIRTYHAYVPIDKTGIAAGYHDITVTSSSGAFTTVAFYIMESVKPVVTTTYYSYIDGHPYIPTPTPITIIERPTPITVYQTVTVTIPVTPSQESVSKAQWEAISTITYRIVGIVIVGTIALYILVAWIRSRRKGDDVL